MKRYLLGVTLLLLIGTLTLPPLVQGRETTSPASTVAVSPILIEKDIPYVEEAKADDESRKMCKLDLYLPKTSKPYPILLWCHGGGLTGGDKTDNVAFGEAMARQGIGVVSINYRLNPHVRYPAYIEDVARAVAWTQLHVVTARSHGKLFIGGHSAGSYLSAMLAMDERYLLAQGVQPKDLAGAILLSGQIMTHFTVRAEKGVDSNRIVSDEAAPAYYVRKNTMPLLLLIGDDDWPARREENHYFYAALKVAGNTRVQFYVIANRNHGSIFSNLKEKNDPCARKMINFILDQAPIHSSRQPPL